MDRDNARKVSDCLCWHVREKQQELVRRNAQYYKPMLSNFEIGEWVWLFDPKLIPGSCVKLRLYYSGTYKIIRKIAPALAEERRI